MRLFIAEKPSVAKAIASELGITSRSEGFIRCAQSVVTWCFGHMLEQADPDAYTSDDAPRGKSGRKVWREQDLPIVPQSWLLRPRPDAQQQLATIGRLLEDATEIVHAGDPDREGQLLVDEVLAHFHVRRPVRRFWVSAQDPTSVRRGLDALRDNVAFAGMADAARARQRADWLIGMNLSRAYTLRAQRGGSDALLTVGRVQTPTLALVVSRDRAIEAFKPRPFHGLEGQFEHPAGRFTATWKPKDDQAGLDDEGRLVDTAIANALVTRLSARCGQLTTYVTEAKKKAPPLCFALSDLTVIASRNWGYSAEQVLGACQALYETHRLTSYPRTDSGHLPEAQHADASAVLEALRHINPELAGAIDQADPRLKSPTWNDAKVTAHHGIVPTMHKGDRSALSAVERHLYELIVRRYLAQFYPAYEYLQTRLTVDVEGEAFHASGHVTTGPGWRLVDEAADEVPDDEPDGPKPGKDEESKKNQALPPMRPADAVVAVAVDRKDRQTKAPARFTEGSLVRAMEQVHKWVTDPEHKKLLREGDGIGTSATRAGILSDLKRRQFLTTQGKHLLSTVLGRALVDAVPEGVKSATLTALYERMLKQIELGESGIESFVERQARLVREQVAAAAVGSLRLPALPAAAPRAVGSSRGAGAGRAAHAARAARPKRAPRKPKEARRD